MIIRELVTRLGWSVDNTGVREYDATFARLTASAERFTSGMRLAMLGIGAAIAGVATGVALAIPAIAKAGDEMQGQINTLSGVLESSDEAARAYDRLYQSARDTGGKIEDTVQSFARYDLALKKNGKTTDEVVDFIADLQQAMVAYGVKGAQAASVTLQLGQALGKGKLNDDELTSIRTAMPQMVEAVRKALNMTDEEFEKAASKGELTTAKVLGHISAFTAEAKKRAADMPLTMDKATKIFLTTWKRFLADIDRAFRISERLAQAIKAVADALERWRKLIPMIAAMVPTVDRLKSSLIALGIMFTVIFGAQLIAALGGAAAAFRLLGVAVAALGRGVLVAMLPFAALAMWFLIIEDFVSWLQGKRSLFGDRLGDFKTFKEQAEAQFDALKERLLGWWAPIGAQLEKDFKAIGDLFDALWERMKEKAIVFRDAMVDIGNAVRDAFLSAFQAIAEKLDALKAFVAAAKEALGLGGAEEPAGSGSDPDAQAQRRRNFQNRSQGLYPEPGAAIGPQSYNAGPQTIQQNFGGVTVNAAGASGAEVAAGARQGVAAAAREMTGDLGGAARSLSMSMPRAETAAA